MEQTTERTSSGILEAKASKLTDLISYQEGAVVSRVVKKKSRLARLLSSRSMKDKA